jgi:hypothetical protein
LTPSSVAGRQVMTAGRRDPVGDISALIKQLNDSCHARASPALRHPAHRPGDDSGE